MDFGNAKSLIGRTLKVGLHGIDHLERGYSLGKRAERFTSEWAFRKEVKVQVQTTDRYGRIVGEVILPEGLNLNQELGGTANMPRIIGS